MHLRQKVQHQSVSLYECKSESKSTEQYAGGLTSISYSQIFLILVHTDFLYVHKGKHDQVEHMLHAWIDLKSGLSFGSDYAQRTPVISSDLGSRRLVP